MDFAGARVRADIIIGVAVAGLIVLSVGACAPRRAARQARAAAASCMAPLQPHLRIDLYTDRSNRNDPSGRMTDEEWKKFVEEVLVQHFPAGGTVFENSGWWRRPNGTTFHGLGRTLVMLVPENQVQADRAPVKAVIDEIKKRYGPSSVGWEERWVCAAF